VQSTCCHGIEYCGHISFVTGISNLISHVVRLEFSLWAAPSIVNLIQGERPKISGGIGVGYGKVARGERCNIP